jgi:cell wall-associated NlpC family hydrolase
LEKGEHLMALISKVDTAPTDAIDVPEAIPQTQGPSTPSAPEQPMETADPSTAAAKKLERHVEAAHFRGELDNARRNPGAGVLYDKKAKPEPGKGATATKTATAVAKTKSAQAAGTSDALSNKVESEAAAGVGKPVVGRGECYDLADAVLQNAGAKSAPDFDKITGSRKQDYKWGTPVELKDVKPGDVLQFRDQHIRIETTKLVKRDGRVIEKSPRPSVKKHHRGPKHTSIVLENNGHGSMVVAEQHVIDPKDPTKLSTTVRKNTLDTESTTKTDSKVRHEGGHEIVEETTVKITVTGITRAYRPEQKGK